MPRKELPNVPWITKDGSVDMGKIPIEYNFQSAIGSNREKAFNSIRIISSASCHGRKDASIFLMGLLVGLPPDDWEMRTAVVEALQYTQNRTMCCTTNLGNPKDRIYKYDEKTYRRNTTSIKAVSGRAGSRRNRIIG